MTNKKEFVNLHAHTGYSIGDGMGQPSKHIDFAIKNGLNAHAFTDHGNMSNVASAYIHQQKLIKEGKQFKLIFGNECYFVPSIDEWRQKKEQHKIDQEELKKKSNLVEDDDVGTVVEDESETKSGLKNDKSKDKELRQRSHLVLLAKNQEGYKNLCKLTSLSGYGDNKYYYPRIDFDMLKKHGKGIIASSACVSGEALLETNFGLISLNEVYERFLFGEEIFCLSYSEEEKTVKFRKILNAVNTNPNAEVLTIKLKNGKTLKLTSDHRVFTNLGWIEAGDLKRYDGVKILSIK